MFTQLFPALIISTLNDMPSKFLFAAFDVDASAGHIDSVRAVVRDELAPLVQRLSLLTASDATQTPSTFASSLVDQLGSRDGNFVPTFGDSILCEDEVIEANELKPEWQFDSSCQISVCPSSICQQRRIPLVGNSWGSSKARWILRSKLVF